MGFKENLKAKIHLDRVYRRVAHTIKEPPDTPRWVDKDLTREILDRTDFEYKKEGNLPLYIRPLREDTLEILVLDNELPVYHTTVEDVILRKNPHWQEMFSIRNVRRIMNDQDVVVSRGRKSLERLHAIALAHLDLTFTREDVLALVEDARRAIEAGAAESLRESLDLFLELLGFETVYLKVLEPDLQFFGRSRTDDGGTPFYEHLLVLNEETLSIGLKKGDFSPKDQSDLQWVTRYAQGLERADLRNLEVFQFLAELALQRQPAPPLS